MKKLLLLLLIIIPLPSFAQGKSKMDELINLSGSLVTNEYVKIAEVNGKSSFIRIHLQNLYNSDKTKSANGIMFQVKGKMAHALKSTIFMDIDEVDNYLLSLNKIIETAKSNKDKNINFEMNIRSKEGLNTVYEQDGNEQSFYVEFGQLESISGDISFKAFASADFWEVKQIEEFRDAIQKAKNL